MDKQKICGIEISNPQKKIFDVTKIDVANYYSDISQFLFPYIKDRLLSVVRFHDGQCFFKKHPASYEDVQRFDAKTNKTKTNTTASQNTYFFLKNKHQLLNQIQLGTIEFHTWCCNIHKMSQPDMMVFDLDPDVNLSLKDLRQGAVDIKNVLTQLNLEPFLKTSGGKGYHVYAFHKFPSWKTFESFCKNTALLLEQKFPTRYTTNIRKDARQGKIFVDFLRNKKGSTCVAPFSLRARKNLPISMPIPWTELYNIKPNQINIKNYKHYLAKFEHMFL